jgi:hypothetical protein
VLRKYPGKEFATIYDIIVEPTLRPSMPLELRELERKMIKKELARFRDFARSSINSQECFEIMKNIESTYGVS